MKELTQAWGVAGREKAVRAIVEREIKDYADEYFTDAVGNLIALKKGADHPDKKKIMLAGFGAGLTWAACLFEWK